MSRLDVREVTGEAVRDSSFYTLLAANVVGLAVLLATDAGLPHLLAAYWAQSVIIGLTSLWRILAIEHFSTEGFGDIGSERPRTGDKTTLVVAFLSIYGGLHYLYFTLVQDLGRQRGVDPFAGFEFWLCAAIFAAHHVYSLWHNLERDAEARPDLHVLLLMPYIRVAPMMLAGAVALAFPAGILPYVVAAALKTWIDLAMHSVEHYVLRKGKSSRARGAWPDLGPPV